MSNETHECFTWNKTVIATGKEVFECYACNKRLKVKRTAGMRWEKWIDGHYRGIVATLAKAQMQLEGEARGEGSAWVK